MSQVMQALVEHYSHHGWLERVEQCVLHMDIGSLDFNQASLYPLYSQLIGHAEVLVSCDSDALEMVMLYIKVCEY